MAKKVVLWIIGACIPVLLNATHQRAAEISYRHLSGYTYEFKITSYTYTETTADRPMLTLNWGDAADSKTDVYRNEAETVIYSDVKIKENHYYGTHTFPGPGVYTIWFEDPNRNGGVLNVPNSVNTPMYVETKLVISPFITPENNSPMLSMPPVDVGCVGVFMVYNPGAVDPDGDSLVYSLEKCKGAGGFNIPGYTYPMASESFSINEKTGDIYWDKPMSAGEYNIAILIKEYRNGMMVGSMVRDMQINIQPCQNHPPSIQVVEDTCVLVGDTLSLNIFAYDTLDHDRVTLTATGDIFSLSPKANFLAGAVGEKVTSALTWVPSCSQVRAQPYAVYFKAKDNGLPSLTDMKTLFIHVLAPAPVCIATAASTERKIMLSWKTSCTEKLLGYKVYRKQSQTGESDNLCETGVHDAAYIPIADIKDTVFVDKNVVPGIIYCYKVVAYYENSVESKASQPVCVSLKDIFPCMLHVDVTATDSVAGRIRIDWTKPLELDTIDNARFYYRILRGINSSQLTVIDSTASINDTIYEDQMLNTRDVRYFYQVVLCKESHTLSSSSVGESAVTSSVFLSGHSGHQQINLSWIYLHPWIDDSFVVNRWNQLTQRFDSLGMVTGDSFIDTQVEMDTVYTYRIKAIGKYPSGNITELLFNHSQLLSVKAVYDTPCPPVLWNLSTSCNPPTALLEWTMDDTCMQSGLHYRVYYQVNEQAPFTFVATTDAFSYEALATGSLHGCYAITAINDKQMESGYSNKLCVNYNQCMEYALPNAFSPNGDGINDVFKALPSQFAGEIRLTIYNRWGSIVYETNDPLFEWTGKHYKTGEDCPTGAYFYSGELFLPGDNSLRENISGSITLLR